MEQRPDRCEPHQVDVHVGRRLRAIRKGAGLSMDAVATQLGITYQQLQKYETGANRISASMLYELGHALRTPVAQFYSGLPAISGPREGDALSVYRIADVLSTPGGKDLIEAFLDMPSEMRGPLVAVAIGLTKAR